MTLLIRRPTAADAPELGRICYEAFSVIADAHGFPPDLPSAEVGAAAVGGMIASPSSFGVAAEMDGNLVGSNFLSEGQAIAGVGPITVDPAVQNDRVGRALMDAVLARAEAQGVAGVRLVQAGYHMRSLALYLKIGFEVREHLSCLQGPPIGGLMEGYNVRAATPAHETACNTLCSRVHGFARASELSQAVARGAAMIVERAGRVTGYATPVAFFSHAVGETTEDIQALIAAAPSIPGPGVLVPSRNGELMRWCLAKGLRVIQSMTLMSKGLYSEPQGAWLPSVLY